LQDIYCSIECKYILLKRGKFWRKRAKKITRLFTPTTPYNHHRGRRCVTPLFAPADKMSPTFFVIFIVIVIQLTTDVDRPIFFPADTRLNIFGGDFG